MNIVLVAPPSIKVPPQKYGGTQRAVYWLAKGLSELGHDVTILAKQGSYVNENVKVIELPDKIKDDSIYLSYLPDDFDIVNFHVPISHEPDFPYLMSMHGNDLNIKGCFPQNTSFVSKKHAENHSGDYFIYNGLDLEEYDFLEESQDYFCYLSKISVSNKNVRYAVDLAKKMGFNLRIGGGWRPSFRRNIKYLGMVGGDKKINLLKNAKGLIFPTNWEEPMGLVVIEALACGTPVIVSNKGAMPELVNEKVGFVCNTEEDYIYAINNIHKIDRKYCRRYIEENFTHKVMTNNYLKLYEKILNSENYKLK